MLGEIGLDPATVDVALDDESTHDVVKAEHDRVVAAGGFGVPTLFFDDQALFGPVLIDPPFGEEALRLWGAVTAWLEFPHLYEIQRPKSRDDENFIADTFRPYIEARDWVSINRGEVITFDRTRSVPGLSVRLADMDPFGRFHRRTPVDYPPVRWFLDRSSAGNGADGLVNRVTIREGR